MSFHELAKSRHSIRKYQNLPVEPDKVDKILQAAMMAPSSKRRTPWEFIVSDDREVIAKLSECRESGSQFLAGAPLTIVVMADTTKSDLWTIDATISATFIQLQAQDLGLGSCWVQVYQRFRSNNQSVDKYICEMLNIPENFAVLCVIGIGYPDEVKSPFETETLAYQKIHHHSF